MIMMLPSHQPRMDIQNYQSFKTISAAAAAAAAAAVLLDQATIPSPCHMLPRQKTLLVFLPLPHYHQVKKTSLRTLLIGEQT